MYVCKPIGSRIRDRSPIRYLFVMLRWARRLEVDSSGYNNLARFLGRMQADPGVGAAEEGRID